MPRLGLRSGESLSVSPRNLRGMSGVADDGPLFLAVERQLWPSSCQSSHLIRCSLLGSCCHHQNQKHPRSCLEQRWTWVELTSRVPGCLLTL